MRGGPGTFDSIGFQYRAADVIGPMDFGKLPNMQRGYDGPSANTHVCPMSMGSGCRF